MKEKTVDVKRKNEVNIEGVDYVLIKKSDLQKLEKAKNNLEYLKKLERAFKNIEEGKVTRHDLIEVE